MDPGLKHPPRIDGVVITELRQISDERGSVLHMFRCDSPEFVRFGECYFSELLPGAVKAWKRNRKPATATTKTTAEIFSS